MTADAWNSGDERLLAELKDALDSASSPERVPESMRTAARAAFAWRGVDKELQLLVLAHDSALEPAPQVRDALSPASRTLSFQGAELSVEIEIENDVMGQLIPPQPGHVTLVTARGDRVEAEADDVGCFRLPLPERGPVKLTCRTAETFSGTEWTTL